MLAQAEQLSLELLEEAPDEAADVRIGDAEEATRERTLPFRVVPLSERRPYENCVPLYSLEAAAGAFSAGQIVAADDWVAPNGRLSPRPGLFVARVTGESMNRRIPNGAYCLFRTPVTGSRDGRVLLVEDAQISDPDNGGRYTVKIYRSVKEPIADGGWRHSEVRLEPDTGAEGYEPIVLRDIDEESIRVVAELVEVLGPSNGA